jgi:membrane-associated phospholipid phosphatase
MEEKLAKFFSLIFQPLLIPSMMLFLIFNLNIYIALIIPVSARRLILGMVFIITFVFPVLMMFILYKQQVIRSFKMETREERILPLFITAIFYFMSWYIIRKLQIDEIYQRIFLGSSYLVLIALVVSLVWKISLHMIGMGGLLGTFIGISQFINTDLVLLIMLICLACGLTGFARLKLNAHTPMQVYAGFVTGIGVMLWLFSV